MLRSTGFFRGIECPFNTDDTDVSGDKNGCNRPYCPFRHSKRRRASYGATLDTRKHKELTSKQKEQAYDPFNPDVVPHPEQQDGESGDLNGALELVNQAIKEVQNEVEQEKRKLSRIGDDEYEPTSKTGLPSLEAAKKPSPKAAASHLAYDPGSYQMTSSEYNPTPCSSKYTLDSDIKGSSANSMEYVPTLMKKAAAQTQASLPTPTYSNNTSSKGKYTLDNSKPSTDMEYDPLSNYSARIAGKHKTDESAKDAKRTSKQVKMGRPLTDDEYVPTAKKPRQESANTHTNTHTKYTFSDTDEESSGTEYRPTSLNRLQRRGSSSSGVTAGNTAGNAGRKDTAKGPLTSPPPRGGEEGKLAMESDGREPCRQKDNVENERLAVKPGHSKNGKSDKVLKAEKAVKAVGGKVGSGDNGAKEKSVAKRPSSECVKTNGQSQRKKEDKSKGVKESSHKVPRELKEEKKNVGKSKSAETRVKGDSSKERATGRENGGGGESKKATISHKEKELSRPKDHQHKNGKQEVGKRANDVSKNSKNSSSGGGGGSKSTSNSGNGKSSSGGSKAVTAKNTGHPPQAKKVKDKRRTPSLSHADLFGDESPEEAEAMSEEEEEDDDEGDEVLVRKSADALKRYRVIKQPAPPKAQPPSSSSGEEDEGLSIAGGQAEMDYCGVDLSFLQEDMDFDSDPMEECLRIFNESKDVRKEDKGRQAKQPHRDSEEEEEECTESTLTTLVPGQKKRVSHVKVEAASKSAVRPYRRPTAQEICYQRLQMAQQQAAQLAPAVKTLAVKTPGVKTPGVKTPGVKASSASSPSSSFAGERKRIAHRPNPFAPFPSKPAERKPATSRVLSPNRTLPAHLSIKAQTSAGIMSKTTSTVVQKRLAHTPTMKSSSMKRPIIPTEFGAKVPTNVRQRYLNIFIDECVKFCPAEDAAFQMALDEEKVVYDRSSSKNIYLNVAVNTLKKLRGKSSPSPTPPPKAAGSASNRRTMSHEEVLGGRHAATTSFTVNRMGKQQEEKLTGAALYRKLRSYLMTDEQLQEHGYPRASPESTGIAVIHNQPKTKPPTDPFTKVCCRCGAEYKVNVHGNCVRKEECNNHWGRLRRHKVSGGWETNYNCCSGAVGSLGCQVSKQHVQDGRKESVTDYVQTFSKALPPDGDGGVFALDCEMCYTTQGLELTRVTVIDSRLKVIYDTFVKPCSKVVDYNTRFSGVTEADLDNTTINMRDVQAVLLSMFSTESILMGHSLESDLLALKLIHNTVIDTAIVFPHRLGLPYKRALRNLMADHLKRIIQDNVDGHDSSEDASACMELMFWKLKEDAKVKR